MSYYLSLLQHMQLWNKKRVPKFPTSTTCRMIWVLKICSFPPQLHAEWFGSLTSVVACQSFVFITRVLECRAQTLAKDLLQFFNFYSHAKKYFGIRFIICFQLPFEKNQNKANFEPIIISNPYGQLTVTFRVIPHCLNVKELLARSRRHI